MRFFVFSFTDAIPEDGMIHLFNDDGDELTIPEPFAKFCRLEEVEPPKPVLSPLEQKRLEIAQRRGTTHDPEGDIQAGKQPDPRQ